MNNSKETKINKYNMHNKSSKRLSIGGLLLCSCLALVVVIAFSGCSTVFADNPVVKSMESGNDQLDLSKFGSKFMVEEKPEEQVTVVSNEEAKIFVDFIRKIQDASSVSYTRSFTYSQDSPEYSDDLNKFLASTNIEVLEQDNKIAMNNIVSGDRLIYDGSSAVIKKITSSSSVPVKFTNKEKRHTLKFAANEARIEIISVEKDIMVDNVSYFVINLKENSQISKWYFDSTGNLTLKMYLDNQDLFAIRYSNINFDVVIEPSAFLIEKEKGIEEDINSLEKTEVKENTIKIPTTSQPTSAEVSPPKAEDIKPAVPVEPQAQPAEQKPNSTAEVKLEETEVKTAEKKVEPAKGPTVGTVIPGAKQTENEKLPVPNDPSKIVEYTKEQQAAANSPSNISDYPSNVLPIISSLNITSAQDSTKNNVRKIDVSGNYSGSGADAASHYSGI